MPQRVPWEAAFACGHALVDDQHRALLAQCDRLADLCQPEADGARDAHFDDAFVHLQHLARQHFESEAALLASQGSPELEDHRFECEEFEYLVNEIVSTEHFDRLELQRFLTHWTLGHIVASGNTVRSCLAGGAPAV
jgi:hemerythrin-like metal-binding protein